jgi:flagellar biosynthetic protein FliQ
MTELDVADLLRATMIVSLKLCAPPLAAMLAVGLLISVLQAVTQINEPTLVFAPKILALFGVFALSGTLLVSILMEFTLRLFDRLIAIGGT